MRCIGDLYIVGFREFTFVFDPFDTQHAVIRHQLCKTCGERRTDTCEFCEHAPRFELAIGDVFVADV